MPRIENTNSENRLSGDMPVTNPETKASAKLSKSSKILSSLPSGVKKTGLGIGAIVGVGVGAILCVPLALLGGITGFLAGPYICRNSEEPEEFTRGVCTGLGALVGSATAFKLYGACAKELEKMNKK